jgi:hypothetical protein
VTAAAHGLRDATGNEGAFKAPGGSLARSPVVPSPAPAGSDRVALDQLRRAIGNRDFANYVRTLARQPVGQKDPPRPVTVYLVGPPPPIHAAARSTEKNRPLAELIDEIDKLSDKDVIERRRKEVYEAQATSAADRRTHELALEAAEYVAKYRHLKQLQPFYDADNPGIRRLDIRVVLEEGIREHHSFKDAFAEIADVPSNDDAKKFFWEWQTSFRKEFLENAYATAFGMLDGSGKEIDRVLSSYGVPVQSAHNAASRLAHTDAKLGDEVAAILKEMHANASGTVDTKEHVHARFDLVDTVRALKHQRDLANQLADKAGKDALSVPINMQGPKAEALLKEQAQANAEKAKFREMWIEAEQLHPVLASYRHGGDVMKVDLDELDTASPDDEMRSVLFQVLPKMGDMVEARDRLHARTKPLSPLAIPSVVAMTKANMFIPKDSLRDGVANDMAEENKDDNKWFILGAFILALVTFLPSGGTSLGIAAGMASVGLAAYSAVHEWEVYSRQKVLSDTDLDIAHALATEEPSLTPFIVSLVSLGLEPLVLVSALNQARKLKALSDVGDDTSAVVNELNQIGKKAGKPELGKEALSDIEDVEEGSTAAKAAKGSKAASTVPKIKETAFGLLNKADARAAALKRFTAINRNLPERWDMVRAALHEHDGPFNREILGLLDRQMGALRDAEAWADVMADAWEIAARMRKPDLRRALLKLAKKRGIKLITVPKVQKGAKFFDEAVVSGRGIIDPALATDIDPALVEGEQVLHGELIHLIQDLVVDHKLGAGASARFRQLLGKAEGTIERFVPGKANVPTKFGAFDGTKELKYNVTWFDQENTIETSMKTGDYVWRFTYDLFYANPALRRMPQPEAMGRALNELFGLK